MNEEKKKELIKESIYEVIYEQIKGLIEIEIGNYYLYKKIKGKYWLHYEEGSGLDVYIINKELDEEDFDVVEMDKNMVLHLHKDDFLYFIMNFKERKQEVIEIIDKYIKEDITKEDNIMQDEIKNMLKSLNEKDKKTVYGFMDFFEGITNSNISEKYKLEEDIKKSSNEKSKGTKNEL